METKARRPSKSGDRGLKDKKPKARKPKWERDQGQLKPKILSYN